MRKQVVKVSASGKPEIVNRKRWTAFRAALREEVASRTLSRGGACEEACEGHGGVDMCGRTFVICEDGEIWLLDP